MTIKQKLWVALGSISAIIFFIGILANSSFNKLDKQNTIYNSIASADNSMYRARLAQADYLLLKELHFKDKVDSFLAAAKNSLAITKEKMVVQSSIKRVSEIKASIDKYRIEFDKISEKNKQLSSKDMAALFEAAGAAALSTEALLADEKAIVAQTQKNATRAILVSVSLTLIICVSLATWLIKSIMNPLTASMKIAERIADGDLTHAQPTKSNDEFSLLINALNKSTAKLREVISQIKSVISKLDDAGITVENAVVESYTSMHQQKDETTILAKSIMHVAGSSENIAQSVEQATTTSSETEREATQGNQKISDASAAMQDLYNELTKASESVNKLNDDSSNVADILDVIRSIAEQTNLLALNAAIEAARAGEQGRGFAVVADEVRTLAGRTQNSIEEITNIIELIQTSAADVVDVIAESNKRSAKVMELNKEASNAYSVIKTDIGQIAEINKRVSSEVNEQFIATEETKNNICSITNLADTNADSLNAIKNQIELQANERNSLNNLVGFFKV